MMPIFDPDDDGWCDEVDRRYEEHANRDYSEFDTIPAPAPEWTEQDEADVTMITLRSIAATDTGDYCGCDECRSEPTKVAEEECPNCLGTGHESVPRHPGSFFEPPDYATCSFCNGTGEVK